MALDTMAMLPGLTMVDTTEDTGVDTGARRRGLPSQMPQLNPMPRLMPNPGTVPMAMVLAIIMVDTVDTMVAMPGHTMVAMPGERRKGQLRPSLPLRLLLMLMLGTDTMAMVVDTMAIADLTMADTTEDTTGVDFPSLGY